MQVFPAGQEFSRRGGQHGGDQERSHRLPEVQGDRRGEQQKDPLHAERPSQYKSYHTVIQAGAPLLQNPTDILQ